MSIMMENAKGQSSPQIAYKILKIEFAVKFFLRGDENFFCSLFPVGMEFVG